LRALTLFGTGVAIIRFHLVKHFSFVYGAVMPESINNKKNNFPLNIMDVLLFFLAGSSMTIISVSFLLWLRF
jgi:hypothetical protein